VKEELGLFDLNVEKVLGDWEIYHAIREVISNALDESILTKTKDIEILKDKKGAWHVRDFGRGLSYKHLTQKENKEKLEHQELIGKFGVGLKDALAVFDRRGIIVLIKSRYGTMSLVKAEKAGFKGLITLHVKIEKAADTNFTGTDFILHGIKDNDIKNAKNLFLKFSEAKRLEMTKYGQVIDRDGNAGSVYINGVKVAEEENFLFSYNITLITNEIKKALNRERTNVGRTAYAGRIKAILVACEDAEVAKALIEDLKEYDSGEIHDELKWIDVQERAVQILNAKEKVLFLSTGEMLMEAMMVDEAKNAGYKIIGIPQNLRDRIRELKDIKGNPIRDLSEFHKEYTESFEFKFVDIKRLSKRERDVFNFTDRIFGLIGGKPKIVRGIRISETMRSTMSSMIDAAGVWEAPYIIIKRSELRDLKDYSGTLLHEAAHASSGAPDVSRDFELKLSEFLGKVSTKALDK
jgi:HSP90 family molecular chaperone